MICTDKLSRLKAPFPYFGGKLRVAGVVWRALGDCGHYIEPFCGSCAVLLARPGYDPTRHVETVNDADGHIANVWRALQAAPDEVARWSDWPVNHADLMARKRVLNLDENTSGLLDRLVADDGYYDAKLAGYYIWAASCWIGHGLIRLGQIPHLGGGGMGVDAKGQIPHLCRGRGVHKKGLRDQGLGARDGGQVSSLVPNPSPLTPNPYSSNIYAWFRQLAERLRHVRVVCGDWSRVCGGNWQHRPGRPVGMFFDPPYSDVAERDPAVYAVDCQQVAHDVREWCGSRADRPEYRMVLAGYYEEHKRLLREGWRVRRWSAQGGYANRSGENGKSRGKRNRHREALFFSPGCRRIPRDI